MKRIGTNFVTVAALLALGAVTATACPLAYAVNFSGQFGLIDLATGVFTPIGKGLDNTPDGIMGAPGGPFYAVDGFNGHLLKIGLDGKVADVGDTHTGPQTGPNGISIIGALSNGSLYAIDFSNRLFSINKDTAALTLVGLLPSLPAQEMDYSGNMVTSLNGDDNRLYFTIEIAEGPRKTGPTLYTINPINTFFGKVSVASHPLKTPGRVIGSGLVNGSFYLFTAEGHIVKLDQITGETTTVASYQSGLTADGPPVTGIFGVIGGIEPNQTHAPATVTVLPAESRGRAYWPPRYAPIPPHAH